ncbi:MAG: hypothetical protein WCI95_01370 [bacterium]
MTIAFHGEIETLQSQIHELENLAPNNIQLKQMGFLAKKISHQSGFLPVIGLPATARDITLLTKLAASICTKAVKAFATRNAGEARAAQEDHTTAISIHDRLMARFEKALGQPGTKIEALLAGRSVIFNLAQISHHATLMAGSTMGMPQGSPT